MAETVATGQIENAKALTNAEIATSKRGLSFAMRLTMAMVGASVVFFALAVAGVGNTAAAITAGSLFLSVPVIMLIRSFMTLS